MRLSERIGGWRRRPFVRAVAVMAGGSAAAQVINVVASPVLTRIYGPEAFGVLGVFVAVCAALVPFAALAYEQAIVLPRTDDEARAVVRLAMSIALGFSLLVLVVLLVSHGAVAELLNFGAPSWFLLLIPLAILVNSVQAIFMQWMVRMKQFKVISATSTGYAAVLNFLRLGLGLLVPTGSALVVGNTAGDISYVGMVLPYVRRGIWGGAESTIPAKKVARDYRDFPLFRAPEVLLNAVLSSLPAIILSVLFGPVTVGLYTLSLKVLQMPNNVISGSVGNAFLHRAAKAGHEGEPVRPLLLKTTFALGLIGLVPFGLVAIFGPWLFRVVFGPEWVAAGQYARWLTLWGFMYFVNTPAVQTIPLLGLQKEFLVFGLIASPIRVAALLFGALVLASGVAAVACFSVAGAFANIVLIAWVVHKSKTSLRDTLRTEVG